MTRDEAIEWLIQIKGKYIHDGDEQFDAKRKEALDMAIEALKERPEGEWLCSDDSYENAVCSNCGFDSGESYVVVKYEQKWKACPMCEARMKGADDEDN